MEKEKSKEKDLMYPFNLWILTLVISLLFQMIYATYEDGLARLIENLEIFIVILVLSFFLSSPVFVIILIFYTLSVNRNADIQKTQLTVIVLVAISVFALFFLINEEPYTGFSLFYVLALIVSAYILYWRQKKNLHKETESSLTITSE